MDNFSEGELNISYIEENGTKIIKWTGISKNINPYVIIFPYLEKALTEVSEIDKVVVDFSSLELMNSSTVPVIIKLIKALETKNVNTIIQYNKSVRWQIVSFQALQAVITGMKNIQLKGV